MKKEDLLLIAMIVIFLSTLFVELMAPRLNTGKNNQATANVVYSEEYTASLREAVIKELYGSREQYASDQTGSRSDYIDKAASKNGELVIDESRMQSVYDSKLKEFDAKVDQAYVDEIVKSRQEQLVKEGAYNHVGEKKESTNRDVMYWKNGGKYFALLVELAMIGYLLYKRQRDKEEY